MSRGGSTNGGFSLWRLNSPKYLSLINRVRQAYIIITTRAHKFLSDTQAHMTGELIRYPGPHLVRRWGWGGVELHVERGSYLAIGIRVAWKPRLVDVYWGQGCASVYFGREWIDWVVEQLESYYEVT